VTSKGGKSAARRGAILTSEIEPEIHHPELTAIAQMLAWASREAESQRDRISATTARVNGMLRNEPFVFLGSEAVAGKFRQLSYDSLANREVILLPVIDSASLVPVLAFKYDWTRSFPELRLRVGLYLEDEAGALAAFGYRLETPEPAGRHQFPHAQPLRRFSASGPNLPCPLWFPDQEPTLPLCCYGSSDLVLSLLISFYGSEVLVSLDNVAGHSLRQWMAEFRTWLTRFNTRLFRYERTGTKKFVVVTTWLNDDALNARAKKHGLRAKTLLTPAERTALVTAGADNEVW
jgi:hypothetical protein